MLLFPSVSPALVAEAGASTVLPVEEALWGSPCRRTGQAEGLAQLGHQVCVRDGAELPSWAEAASTAPDRLLWGVSAPNG